uniref:Uncharacterized protein n=1 Tax=Ananas comosus var. bracteatus TaxID=296719 RepID=A0A6V7P3N7_ANACO|nr:unnamed protein product [Ananas comosus var. bracteatus]
MVLFPKQLLSRTLNPKPSSSSSSSSSLLFSPLFLLLRRRTLASSSSSSSSSSSAMGVGVGVFWDLSSKPPTTTLPLRDVAVRLHLAASSFGPLRLSLAFASLAPSSPPLPHPHPHPQLLPPPHAASAAATSSSAPSSSATSPRSTRPSTPSASAASPPPAAPAASASPPRSPQARQVREGRARPPRRPRGPADELRRAGVTVRAVEGAPRRAIRDRAVGAMDEGILACVVLVSDDSGLAEVLGEARRRRLRTVVVGDEAEGPLRRSADVGFRWAEVVSGKARAAAPAMVGRWRDREMLKRLEWSFNEDEDEDEDEIESEGFEWDSEEEEEEEEEEGGRENGRAPWWELD